MSDGALRGRRIAVPETREAELLVQMLEAHGAETVACPMVTIVDLADPAPVRAWIERFLALRCDDLVLLTGEGLRRLVKYAGEAGAEATFRAALARTRKITRGPKPAAALRALGLTADLRAADPTTDGIIATLADEDVRGRRIGVQCYPGGDDRLADFLIGRGAIVDPVLPYAYASQAEDARIVALIERMAAGEIDAIAFTSRPQVERLFAVAAAAGCEATLQRGLAATAIAAIGPVVTAALARRDVVAAIQPERAFFLKPLVSAIVAAFAR